MKLLKNILNVVIWTILGLYLIFIFLTNIPAVQEYMGGRVAKVLARKLGTSVSIGQLHFGLPTHLTLDDVLIKDQQGKDMLRATRLSARIDLLPLAEGKISIATAQLFGTHARLYQAHADSKPNFQFVLDSLASKDNTDSQPIDLRINSLIIRHSSVRFDRLDAEKTPDRLNPQHLKVSDISAHIIIKTLTPDSLNVNIKRLGFKEQSGLTVERIAMKYEGGRESSRLTDFMLRMPGTHFQLGDIEASYKFRGEHFVSPSLKYTGSIKPSTITLSDIACLLPSLKTFNSTLSIASTFHGQGESLEVPSLTVGSNTGDISIDIGGSVSQLRQKAPYWTVNIHDMALSAKTVNFISENLQGNRIDVPEAVTRLGNIHIQGSANGSGLDEIVAHNRLNSDVGNVELSFTMDQKRQFSGQIDTQSFDLGRLLDDKNFGTLSTNIELSGRWPANDYPAVNAQGVIHQFDYNNYAYQNIGINGFYSKNDIHGELNIDDPNIALRLEGMMTKSQTNNVKLNANIRHLSPKAIHLTDQWDDAQFDGELSADLTAQSLDKATGTVDVSNVTMYSTSEHYKLQKMHIESGYQDDLHYLTLDSDFGHAEVTGAFDYGTIAQSFTNFLAAKLPTLPGLPKLNPDTHNNFDIKASINRSDWLEQLLQIPLHLSSPLELKGTVNDDSRQIMMECLAPAFSYKGERYEHGRFYILSPLNTLQYDISVDKLSEDNGRLSLQATGSAYNNQLSTSLIWDNHTAERMRGKVTAKAVFDTSFDGKQTTNIDIASSSVTINNAEWNIEPCRIVYADKHLGVNHFAIRHGDQYLMLNGTASEQIQDSISVRLRDIDVEYVLDLVGFDAVDFNGLVTGKGSLRGVFSNLEADAALTVRQFEFEHGRMGTLSANVAWNQEEEQIDIHATADDGPDAMTYIEGYVSPKREFIDLGIRAAGTHLDFAQSFTSSFTSKVDGHAVGELRLAGPLDAINLTGGLVLNGQVDMKALGCSYELRNDSLRLIPNEIEFLECPIYDSYGKRGIVTGGIHHKDLTELTFDIYVKAEELLAYNFKDFGEDTFYGTVYANGSVGIHGRDEGIVIEADVTPLSNSVFVYNAASPDAITNQEFIVWGDGGTRDGGTTVRGYENSSGAKDNLVPPSPVPTSLDKSDLTLRLKINATPDAAIRLLMDPRTNDYITLRGTGDLQATYYNKGGFTMNGTYRVSEGTYGITIQDIIKKNFIFKEGGTIVFGGDPYNASLNLQAQYIVNGVSLSDLNVGKSFSNTVRVNCLMNITGQPRQPIVDFDFEMPNVNADEQQMVRSVINGEEEMNQQVIYLLAVGRFYPQGANNASETEEGPSKTSLAMQSLLSGTLSGQINNVLNSVIKSNNWNFGANISTGDEGWNNAEYEGLISGRLLNNRLLINGQFGYRDNATTATPSFIGDFDISYLLMPNGNLALKVYNQTNDRYFTRSSLNTQGIGFIMKKDFWGLGDLFGIKKKKNNTKKVKKP